MGEKPPVPGVPGSIMFSPFGLQPLRVTEDTGRTWSVLAVLDHWRNQDWQLFGPLTPAEWWVLRVEAMTPGPAGEWPEAVLQVTAYSDRPSWWITTLPEAAKLRKPKLRLHTHRAK